MENNCVVEDVSHCCDCLMKNKDMRKIGTPKMMEKGDHGEDGIQI